MATTVDEILVNKDRTASFLLGHSGVSHSAPSREIAQILTDAHKQGRKVLIPVSAGKSDSTVITSATLGDRIRKPNGTWLGAAVEIVTAFLSGRPALSRVPVPAKTHHK